LSTEAHRDVANPTDLWETVAMTNQQTQQRPQRREDYKVQKLVEHIERKLALKTKDAREVNQAKN
jgi:hypothetical protein